MALMVTSLDKQKLKNSIRMYARDIAITAAMGQKNTTEYIAEQLQWGKRTKLQKQ